MANFIVQVVKKMMPETVYILSGPLRGTRWCSRAGSQQFWLGTYEQEKQKKFFDTVAEGNVVYDIGANSGLYTLLASKAGGDSGHIYAFEPSERNLDFLQRHVRLNGCTNVTVLPCAVANESGTAYFDQGENHATGHLSMSGDVAVKVVTVDELVASGEAQAPDILKIDVEGAEVDVLVGATTVLQNIRPVVFLAIHGSKQYEACTEILRNANYTFHTTDERHNVKFGALYFDYLAEISAWPGRPITGAIRTNLE